MEIWIGRDGERHGPYKEEDVRQWLHSGQVTGDDLAWYEGLADWQPLSVLFPDAPAAAAVSSAPPPIAPLPQTTAVALEDYAGFWKRLAAFILDYIVLYIPGKLIGMMFGAGAAEAVMRQAQLASPGDPQVAFAAMAQYLDAVWPAFLLSAVVTWLYFAFLESSTWQATVGKLALGIRVTDLHGERISLPRALGRYPAKMLSFLILYIGVLMVAWTPRKQGLHDMIAGTLVLNGRANEFNSAPARPTSGSGSFSA
jgi:uncharacterized RDD family membrane protein YckC